MARTHDIKIDTAQTTDGTTWVAVTSSHPDDVRPEGITGSYYTAFEARVWCKSGTDEAQFFYRGVLRSGASSTTFTQSIDAGLSGISVRVVRTSGNASLEVRGLAATTIDWEGELEAWHYHA